MTTDLPAAPRQLKITLKNMSNDLTLASFVYPDYPKLEAPSCLEAVINNGFAIGMIQSRVEALAAAAFIHDTIRPHVIVELGTLCGGWLYVMSQMLAPGLDHLLVSVDAPWAERDPKIKWPAELFHRAVPGLYEVIGNIHTPEVRAQVATLTLGGIDLLFIDADHSYEGTKQHWEMYAPLVRPGGWIGFHDIRNGWPCGRFYDELCRHNPHVEFVGKPPEEELYGIGFIEKAKG